VTVYTCMYERRAGGWSVFEGYHTVAAEDVAAEMSSCSRGPDQAIDDLHVRQVLRAQGPAGARRSFALPTTAAISRSPRAMIVTAIAPPRSSTVALVGATMRGQ
jgi:hypothetical protein